MDEILQKTGMHNDKKNSHIVRTANPQFPSPPYVTDERAVVRDMVDSMDQNLVRNWRESNEHRDIRLQKVKNYRPDTEFAGHVIFLDKNDPRKRLGDPEKRYGDYIWIEERKEDKKGRDEVDKRDQKDRNNWRAGCTERDQRKNKEERQLLRLYKPRYTLEVPGVLLPGDPRNMILERKLADQEKEKKEAK